MIAARQPDRAERQLALARDLLQCHRPLPYAFSSFSSFSWQLSEAMQNRHLDFWFLRLDSFDLWLAMLTQVGHLATQGEILEFLQVLVAQVTFDWIGLQLHYRHVHLPVPFLNFDPKLFTLVSYQDFTRESWQAFVFRLFVLQSQAFLLLQMQFGLAHECLQLSLLQVPAQAESSWLTFLDHFLSTKPHLSKFPTKMVVSAR